MKTFKRFLIESEIDKAEIHEVMTEELLLTYGADAGGIDLDAVIEAVVKESTDTEDAIDLAKYMTVENGDLTEHLLTEFAVPASLLISAITQIYKILGEKWVQDLISMAGSKILYKLLRNDTIRGMLMKYRDMKNDNEYLGNVLNAIEKELKTVGYDIVNKKLKKVKA